MEEKIAKWKRHPFSYSQLACWEWSKADWFKKYVLLEKPESSPEMEFGKIMAESIEAGKPLAPVTVLEKCEHEFKFKVMGISCIGYADTFDPKTCRKLGEFKSGVKKWDQNRVDTHKQLDFYCLGNFIINKVRPEETELFLEWIPTKKIHKNKSGLSNGEYTIEFVKPIKVTHFKTKRTMNDIIALGSLIKTTREEMLSYAQSMLTSCLR